LGRLSHSAAAGFSQIPGAQAPLTQRDTLGLAGSREVRFAIRGVPVVYDAAKHELVCRDRRNPLPPVNGKVRLQVLVDRTSLEIFGNDGLLYMPMAAEFAPDDLSLALTVFDTAVRFASLEANELKSIWPRKEKRPGHRWCARDRAEVLNCLLRVRIPEW
jgi:hypothetical protein